MTETTHTTRPTMAFPALCLDAERRILARPRHSDQLVQIPTYDGEVDHRRITLLAAGHDALIYPAISNGEETLYLLADGDSIECAPRPPDIGLRVTITLCGGQSQTVEIEGYARISTAAPRYPA